MRNDKFRTMIGLPTMKALKTMNAEVAQQKAQEGNMSKIGAVPAMNLPVDGATGLPQLLSAPPRKAGARKR
eukprot:gene3986-14064_t